MLNLSGNELTHNSSGNTRPQSSQLAEPMWTDPGIKSGISVRTLSPLQKKKKKKARAGNEFLALEEKAITTTTTSTSTTTSSVI